MRKVELAYNCLVVADYQQLKINGA